MDFLYCYCYVEEPSLKMLLLCTTIRCNIIAYTLNLNMVVSREMGDKVVQHLLLN